MLKPNERMVALFKRAKELLYKHDEELQVCVEDELYWGTHPLRNWAGLFDVDNSDENELKSLSLDENIIDTHEDLFKAVLIKLLEHEFKDLPAKLHTSGYGWSILYDGIHYDIAEFYSANDYKSEEVSLDKLPGSLSFNQLKEYEAILKDIKQDV